jgi:hypothetical protein
VQAATGTPAAGQVPNTASGPSFGAGSGLVLVFVLLFVGSIVSLAGATAAIRRRR